MKSLLSSSTRGAQAFIFLSLLISIAGVVHYGLGLQELAIVFLGYFVYGCLGIVVTFHRLHTHNSYQARPWLSKIFSVFGCLAGTGSPMAWVAIHINHHLKSDKPGDPHSPLHKGIKIFTLAYEGEIDDMTKWRMRKLITDRFQQFLHRYYFAIMLAWDIVLYIIGGFYLVVFLHLLPAAITALMSNVVNYVGHMPSWWGAYRLFNLKDQSVNNWLWSIPSWGESWHNNHHRFPKNSSYTQRWWELDISGGIIKLIRR